MEKYNINLQLFADGGAAGGDGGAAAAAAGDSTGVQAPDAGVRKSRKRENPLANVQYGVQQQSAEQAAPADGAAEQGTETEESFESLIKGKYKAEADAYIQNIIRERFKNHQNDTAELEELRKLKTSVAKKFNVDDQDLTGIIQAVEYDEEALEMEAIQRGMSVDSLKTVKRLEEQNKQLMQREQKSIAEQRMQQHFNSLAQQAEGVKAAYPNFDLMQEMNNPTFARLTAPGVGIDPKTAYEIVHKDEIMAANAQAQAQAFAKSVKANGARPAENGLHGEQGASTVKTDPRTLTPADRAEIRRRVARGERIVF